VSEGSVKKERKWVFGLMSDPSIFFLVEQLSGVARGGGVVLVRKQGGKELAF